MAESIVYVPNQDACSVCIERHTGKTTFYWPHEEIVERLAVSQENHDGRFNYRLMRSATDSLANWQSRASAVAYMGEQVILQAEARVVQLHTDYENLILAGRQTWQYKLIQAEADELGWPTHYASDLTRIDAYFMATRNPEEFLWSIRETGTNLILPPGSREWQYAHANQRMEGERFYHVSRQGLRQITPERFRNFSFAKEVIAA